MKLLFEHNLSPRLVVHLADVYPDSNHVYLLGLDTAEDNMLWEYARDNDYIIVTKDSDFQELTMIRGFPPKVVWIRRGNCTTGDIESMLRLHIEDVKTLSEDQTFGILTLY
ncbi:MAG: DUF5615 family PIN-like protein [Scytonema sp. RU_4_4]|nr:DUF5615 family PIN-like protein [Scytonema sp. RU_4_4]NJR74952.1 DUF5615 family PIN-like protein [Scytonema sp. CRU_2_7]